MDHKDTDQQSGILNFLVKKRNMDYSYTGR